MEALTISAANLNIIEENLGAVAKELGGVITNVNEMNNQVNDVEQEIASLNGDIQALMKEVRENTVITNARQTIMYNDRQIEKKYGYFDNLRRTSISLLDAIENSSIRINTLKTLKEDILLNNPDYWLANALAALTYWLLDDKKNADIEVKNALRKNEEKTSIFFCLINLKLGRTDASINWLNKYLSIESPINLNTDFITVLDLISTGTFGQEQKELTFKKIDGWIRDISSNQNIVNKQIDTWTNYIRENESLDFDFYYLNSSCKDINTLENNLYLTSSYETVYNKLNEITLKDSSNKKIDDILKNLIFEYEEKEQVYQSDNLRNKLLISCNGNKAEAEILYNKQKEIYSDNQDILSLLTNIVIYKDLYTISNETQKIALSIIKNYILKAYEEINKKYLDNEFEITINDFTTRTRDGRNIKESANDLDSFLDNKFDIDDKSILILQIVINIVGIISIFITINSVIFCTILIIALLLSNVILFVKLNNRNQARNREKNRLKTIYYKDLENNMAEATDYINKIAENRQYYDILVNFLSSLDERTFVTSNNERNIAIDNN